MSTENARVVNYMYKQYEMKGGFENWIKIRLKTSLKLAFNLLLNISVKIEVFHSFSLEFIDVLNAYRDEQIVFFPNKQILINRQ